MDRYFVVMKLRKRSKCVLAAGLLFLLTATVGKCQVLRTDFYSSTCPTLNTIVATTIASHLSKDITSGAPLLRMFFHDCFVQGCDGSVLIDSTANNTAEKNAEPNQTLRQFNIIDEIKAQLEKACPRVVSCADIIALAAREAVVQSGGPSWNVELGRRDGRISRASDALTLLPPTRSDSQSLIDDFETIGLSVQDLVTLSGAHTIGRAHCFATVRRYIGFNSTNGIDPTLNLTYALQLRRLCPLPINMQARVALDPVTPNLFDTQYYRDLLVNKGIFTSDSTLASDERSLVFVREYAANQSSFFEQFPLAMIRLGQVGVKTGASGEIRKKCRVVNKL
ncbi:hypothetical protein O6H91_13G015500 [Diphasiastrum complanatum]|uniref:Uncharacterized protein n=1 Tax=Diphasiastrum complanatum TaxID=34168 RepID=A0ACC2BSE8_DIPCM|nr:hypothetical protein O6H91_13G015500 [Diphasiastrum complanatum]